MRLRCTGALSRDHFAAAFPRHVSDPLLREFRRHSLAARADSRRASDEYGLQRRRDYPFRQRMCGAARLRLSSLPRYYQFTKSSTYAAFVYVTSSMYIGHIYTLSVRTQCDDPSTEVANGSVPFPFSGVAMVTIPSGLPTGQHWIVASGIERGLEYVISVDP